MIAEPLSTKIDMSEVIFGPGGFVFANKADFEAGKIIDVGRYIYVMLSDRFHDDDDVTDLEAWHDHRHKVIRAGIGYNTARGPREAFFTFYEEEAAAWDHRAALINTRIEMLHRHLMAETRTNV